MTPSDRSAGVGELPRHTREEVMALIEAMTPRDMMCIDQAARYFAPRSGMDAGDLMQEALVRVMDTRSCKVGTDIVEFVCGTIRSIASDGYRATKRARENEETGTSGELVFAGDLSVLADAAANDDSSPEDAALARVYHRRELERVLSCISDDEALQLLLEGLFDGMVGKDLEELLSTDARGVAAARKRFGRRLAAEFPQGAPI